MFKYELLVIIANHFNATEAAEKAQEAIVSKVKELGGEIVFEDFWGARGFAYKIKKQKWGYYFCIQFNIFPEKTLEFKRFWNIDVDIVRFLLRKVESDEPAPRVYAELKAEYEAQEKPPEKKVEAPQSREKLTNVGVVDSVDDKKKDVDKVENELSKIVEDALT